MEQRLTPLLGDQPALLQVLKSCREQLGSASVSYQTAAVAGCDPDMIALLRSIPGVGQTIAPTLLIEIGDIARFKSARQVVAYAGLDPRVLQSGSTLNRYGHLTKRGAPHLRRALFLAANVAKQHDPVCKALYDKKRAEGKRYREAVLVVARKLLRIIFAVWKSGTPYRCTA
jgi:transposase